MATNVANQAIPRHPISGMKSNPAVRRFSPTAAPSCRVSARPSTPQAIRRSEDADARRTPGMTISI
jgi:hypothetical protein